MWSDPWPSAWSTLPLRSVRFERACAGVIHSPTGLRALSFTAVRYRDACRAARQLHRPSIFSAGSSFEVVCADQIGDRPTKKTSTSTLKDGIPQNGTPVARRAKVARVSLCGGVAQNVLGIVPESAFVDLAARIPWQCGDDRDAARHLVVNQFLATMFNEILHLDFRLSTKHDKRKYVLAQLRMWHADHRGLVHSGMLDKHVFDLDRSDFKAAAHNHVLHPVDMIEIAFRIHVSDIA